MKFFLSRIFLPLVILAVGVVVWRFQLGTKEEPAATRRPRPAVETEVLVLQPVDFPVVVETQGTVRAQNETSVTAGVSGRVARTSPVFETGAFFQKGDVLLTLDDADYRSALAAAEAQVARAEAELLQEDSRARQALLNWSDLGYEEAPSDLVLRKPQMRQAESSVKAARAALDQAQRNLDRTVVLAPYNGRTRLRVVSQGQSVGAQTDLGTIFSTDAAEVRLPLSGAQVAMVDLPDRPGDASLPVTVSLPRGEGFIEREAELVRTEGVLDETTRELFVIAVIRDPFGLEGETEPVRIGQPVRVEVAGRTLEDVYVISRKHLRSLDEVIIISEESTIMRRELDPVWATQGELIVKENLMPGEMLSTSPLTYAPEGGKVKVVEAEAPVNAAAAGEVEPGA